MLCKTGRFRPFPLHNKSFRTKDHPGLRGNSNSLLMAVSTVVPTSTMPVCGPPSHHSVPPGLTVTTSVHVSWMASRTICMLGGSYAALTSSRIFKEVSRLAAAPRRPTTNRMYDDRWLRFAHWAALCITSLIPMDHHLYYPRVQVLLSLGCKPHKQCCSGSD